MKTLENNISRLIFIILIFSPILISPGIFDNTYFIKASFIIVITMLISVKHLLYAKDKSKTIYNYFKEVRWFLGYFFFIAVSTIFSVDPLNSIVGYENRWEGLIVVSCYVLLFFFSAKYFELTEKRMNFLLVLATFLSFISIFQFLGNMRLNDLYYPINDSFLRPYSTLGNPNYLGNLMTIFICISVYHFLKTNHIFYLVGSGLFYLVQLMTLTRGAWLGTVTGLIVLFSFFIRVKAWKQIGSIIITFIFITIGLDLILGGVIVLRFFSILMEFFNLTTSNNPDPEGGSYRILLWSTAIKEFPRRPFLGVGISNIGYIFESYHPQVKAILDSVGVSTERVHNELLQIAVTTGIFSLICYLAGFGSIIRRIFKNVSANNDFVLYLAILIGYFTQSLFSSSVISFSYYFWIMLGSALYKVRKHELFLENIR